MNGLFLPLAAKRRRSAGGGGGGGPIDATNPSNLPVTSVVTIQAYIHAWNGDTSAWEEGIVVFVNRAIMPVVINRGQPDERVYNSAGAQFPVIVPTYVAGLATMTFEDRDGNIGAFSLLRPTLLQGEFRPASSAYMAQGLGMSIDIAAWEIGDSYRLEATSLTALNAIGYIPVLDGDGNPGVWLPGASYTYSVQPAGDQETAHWDGTAWVSGAAPAPSLDAAVLDILAGTPGFRIDPSNLSTMFQDSAGTIPVTASGQPVGRINTQGGTTVNNFNQPTVAAQPTLANLNALLGDGVDDLLGGPTPWVFVNMPALFLCFEAELVAYPPANRGMYGFSNNQTIFVQLNVNEVGAISVSMINALGPPASANGAMLVGQKHVVTLICDWTTEGRYEVFVDGVVVTSVVRGPTTAPAHSNVNRHRLMANISNTVAPVNARMGRLVLSNQLMTPTQKAVLEAWVADGPFDPAPPPPPAAAWRMPEDFSTLPPDGGVLAHNGQDWRNISLIPNLWEPGIFGWEAET